MNQDATDSLLHYMDGREEAAEELMPLVYEELRRVAANYLKNERADHTLQATALVNEAYLRLIDLRQIDWRGKAHFVAMAARFMRRILVDHARSKGTGKRSPNGEQIPMRVAIDMPATSEHPEDTLAIDEVLKQLESLNARHARVVELRHFAGLSVRETAHVLGVSEKTVKNDWKAARAWLLVKLQ